MNNTIENIETTNSSSVDEVLNMIESANDIDEITNEILLQSIINKSVEPQPETPKVETSKAAKQTLNVKSLTLPTGVIMEIKTSFVKFSKDTKKIALKKCTAELNCIIENLDPNMKILTADEIKAKHLGTMKALLTIENDQHLQTIINAYFA